MTTLASARSTERPTSTRLLAIAKVVGVVVALGYLAVNAIGLWWMRGYQITWTWVGVLGWILPPAAAVIALAWPRAGGVAFLLAAGLELYQQINLYVSAQGEEWQLSVGALSSSIVIIVGPALLAGAFLLIADQRARVTGARAAAPSGPGGR